MSNTQQQKLTWVNVGPSTYQPQPMHMGTTIQPSWGPANSASQGFSRGHPSSSFQEPALRFSNDAEFQSLSAKVERGTISYDEIRRWQALVKERRERIAVNTSRGRKEVDESVARWAEASERFGEFNRVYRTKYNWDAMPELERFVGNA